MPHTRTLLRRAAALPSLAYRPSRKTDISAEVVAHPDVHAGQGIVSLAIRLPRTPYRRPKAHPAA